jgi:hypothetical protein
MVLAVLLLMSANDQDTRSIASEGSGTSDGTGCGSCLCGVVLLVLLVVGFVAVVHSAHPDPPVPAVSYTQGETTPDYVPRALPVDNDVLVCRGILVRLPKSPNLAGARGRQ